ncbi:MAG: hypothetical protein AABY22_09770 [Nanoarchaeota archaeon]
MEIAELSRIDNIMKYKSLILEFSIAIFIFMVIISSVVLWEKLDKETEEESEEIECIEYFNDIFEFDENYRIGDYEQIGGSWLKHLYSIDPEIYYNSRILSCDYTKLELHGDINNVFEDRDGCIYAHVSTNNNFTSAGTKGIINISWCRTKQYRLIK